MYDALQTVNAGGETFDRSARSFFGAMAGFIVLDSVLLLWLLNPFAGLAPRTHAYPRVDRAAIAAIENSAPAGAVNKPSPFGSAAKATGGRGGASAAMRTAPAFVEVNR